MQGSLQQWQLQDFETGNFYSENACFQWLPQYQISLVDI